MAASDHADDVPRLGTVVRFKLEAAGTGVRELQSGGFRVASSRDFRSASAVPNDFGGADVQYFERFGIADGLRRLAEDYPFQPRALAVSTSNTNP